MSRLVLLSFDTEEFDIPLEYGRAIPEEEQFRVGAEGLAAVLELLDRLGVVATFFTTARFAMHEEGLMRRVAAGHEVASHGFSHSTFVTEDLARSREVLERVCGVPVTGFRRARLAATDPAAVAGAGYRYNSSENPTWLPGRYNNLSRPRRAFFAGELLNIPVSVTPRARFPLFWLTLKNLPMWAVRRATAGTLVADGVVNLYYHPWEFTDVSGYGLPWYIRRRSGRGMVDRLARYLEWLKGRARFATFGDFDRLMRAERR